MGMTSNDLLRSHGIQHPNGVTEENRSPAATWADVANSCISGINRVNNDPLYGGANLNKDGQLQKLYDDAVTKLFNDRLTDMGVVPMNKIDAGAFLYSFDRKAQRFVRVPVQIAHQNAMGACPDFSVNLDDNGFVVGIKAIAPKGETGPMWQSDMMNDVADFLEHHGIKGMHWGVRKDNTQKTVQRRVKKFKAQQKVKAKRQKVISGRRSLSDAGLKAHIDRLMAEKKFKDLAEADIKPGRAIAKRILSDSGQKVARTVITGAGLLATKAAIDKATGTKFDPKLLSEFMKSQLKKKK